MHITNRAISFGVATMLGLCAVAPVSASPMLSNAAALKSAADNTVTEVRYGIRRGVARAAVATGVGLAVAGAARSYPYGYGYPNSYGYQSYNYGYPSSYGYTGYSTSYAPSSYNYGYGVYSYNYGYGVRSVARRVARRAHYRR